MELPGISDLIRLIQSVSATELAFVAFLAIVLGYLAVQFVKGPNVPIWAKLIVFGVVAALVFTGMLLVLGKSGPPRPGPGIDREAVYYAFYGINDQGEPTVGGQLRVSNSLNPQPVFEDIREGTILVTVTDKFLRRLPTRASEEVGPLHGHACLIVVAGQRVPVPPEPGLKSGGYLPVRVTECPPR